MSQLTWSGTTWTYWIGKGKGHKDFQEAGPCLLREKAVKAGVAQAEEEKAPGRPYSGLPIIGDPIRKKVGGKLLSRVCCYRTRDNVFNLRVDLD